MTLLLTSEINLVGSNTAHHTHPWWTCLVPSDMKSLKTVSTISPILISPFFLPILPAWKNICLSLHRKTRRFRGQIYTTVASPPLNSTKPSWGRWGALHQSWSIGHSFPICPFDTYLNAWHRLGKVLRRQRRRQTRSCPHAAYIPMRDAAKEQIYKISSNY